MLWELGITRGHAQATLKLHPTTEVGALLHALAQLQAVREVGAELLVMVHSAQVRVLRSHLAQIMQKALPHHVAISFVPWSCQRPWFRQRAPHGKPARGDLGLHGLTLAYVDPDVEHRLLTISTPCSRHQYA